MVIINIKGRRRSINFSPDCRPFFPAVKNKMIEKHIALGWGALSR